jgi:hypothetical protein
LASEPCICNVSQIAAQIELRKYFVEWRANPASAFGCGQMAAGRNNFSILLSPLARITNGVNVFWSFSSKTQPFHFV